MESSPATARPVSAPSAGSGKRIILACAVGNFVEWFDFTLYGFSITIIATVFFPQGNSTAALIGAFALYGVTFLARPAGAVFFGRLGDRRGRRTSLASSIVVMGAATGAIGLIPSYETVGLLAPALLLLCRLAQGFSAGGEYTGAATYVAEHAPSKRRGMWVMLALSSTMLASAAATATILVFRLVSAEAFAAGGWRWPFVIGGLLALVGVYLRLKLDETPVFTEVSEEGAKETQPLRELLRNHSKTVLVLLVYFANIGVLTHMFLGYMPSYLDVAVGVAPTTALYAILVIEMITVALTPLGGWIIDRVGRRPLLRIGLVGSVVTVIPAYLLIGTGNVAAIVVGLMLLMFCVGTMSSALLAVLEMYPVGVRFSGVALPYNVAYAAFAGTAPLVSEALVAGTGSILAPAFYATALAIIACPILLRAIPETRNASMRHGAGAPH